MFAIHAVRQNKKRFLPLLLLADPSEAMIDRYLDRGALYVLADEGATEAVCVAVVEDRGEQGCELKNLATAEKFRNRGFASRMLDFLFSRYASTHRNMLVGTSEQGVPFYRRFGFVYSHTVTGFFTDNYPDPIYEEGVRCEDMVYLCRPLIARPRAGGPSASSSSFLCGM